MVELAIIVSLVVIISAACSLFEAALYSIPISQIESLAHAGKRAGRTLQRLRKDVDRPIAAILSLNTIANTAGAAVAGAAAEIVFGHQWLGYFSAAFTLTVLIFSEVVPKTIGVVYSRNLAPFIAWPLHLLVWLMSPLVWLTRLATRLISRGQAPHTVSQEELITLVRLGGQTGTLHADKVEAITNILSLESRTVKDILTPRTVVFARSGRLTIGEIREEASAWSHSRIPIYNENLEDVVGFVHRRNVLMAIADDRFDVKLMDLMRPIHFVPDTLSLDSLLRTALENHQHIFAAIDHFGGLAGVVTLEDVLEEILGQEIVDEFDQEVDMQELARRRREEILKNRLDS